jgi:hypothetical protein
MKHEFSEMVL